MSPPASSFKLNADSKQLGLRFASSIESVLRRLRLDRVTVLDKDRDKLNKCYAPGHPDYIEYEGDFQSSEAYQFLDKVANALRRNPTQRTFIVDHSDTKCTEDSVWVSLPKWQHDHDLPSIYWHVVTERSIEKSVFREVFSDCDWSIEHDDGPRGTTFVSKYVYADENEGPEAHKVFKRHYGTLFSDQPEVVAQQGLECGAELYSAATRFGTFPKPVVRIFRCAPREPLIEGMTRVMKQQLSDNVFNIWIRHSEAPEKMLEGFGKYEFQVDDAPKSPLEILTSIIVSDEAADEATVISISSPLSADKYHIKSSLHVSLPKEIPELEIDNPNDSAGVSPLNSPETHFDSTALAPFSVEAVLSPSIPSKPKIEEATTPISNDAVTPKRGSARRSNSSSSDNDLESGNMEIKTKQVDPERNKKGMGRKSDRKSPASTPAKKGPLGTTSQKPSASGNSASGLKDDEGPDGVDRVGEKAEESVHSEKKTPSRKKRSKKKSKSPTRTQTSPNSGFHEEKKDIDDESRNRDKASSPSSSIQNPDLAENLKESQKNLVCSSCKKTKKKHEYSKAQLKKKDERRCVDCIQNDI